MEYSRPMDVRLKSDAGAFRAIQNPLAECQRRMLIAVSQHPTSAQFNVSLPVEVRGPLDTHVLKLAFQRAVSRHDMLRAVFTAQDQVICQSSGPFRHDLTVLDLPDAPDHRVAEAVAEALRHDMRAPISVMSGQMVRGMLLRQNPQRHILNLTFHHIAVDGRSVGVFVDDLLEVYDRLKLGQPVSDLAVAPQFADTLRTGAEQEIDPNCHADMGFWLEELRTPCETGGLKLLGPGPPRRWCMALGPRDAEAVEAFTSARRTTLNATFLAAVARWTQARSGVGRRRIGVQVDGRTAAALDGVVGPMVTTLPLVFDLRHRDGRHLIQHVTDRLLEGYFHLGAPIESVVAKWATDAPEGACPAALLFAFDGAYAPPPSRTGLALALHPYDRHWAPTPEDMAGHEAIVVVRWGGDRFGLELIAPDGANGLSALSEIAAELRQLIRPRASAHASNQVLPRGKTPLA